MNKYLLVFLIITSCHLSFAQEFTEADELKGSITPERAWWDLQHYELEVAVDPEKQFIEGTNVITYTVTGAKKMMQIDLQSPMEIDKITQNGKKLKFKSKGNAHFIKLKQKQVVGEQHKITISFSGKPIVAKNAPWDGGFVFTKDANGNHFIANANQGIGASVWWPNKDHPADEPDQGIDLIIEAPKNLTAVGNGRLIEKKEKKNNTRWHWKVINPINNYGVNVNIGDYVSFGYTHEGIEGPLEVSYYVLRDHLEKAKEQFKQVPMMLQAFEYWFGPYPFYEDSYKLVEVPYLGMEHQSSVTYGNQYQNGYLGQDLSGSGWGTRFDFIIIHESGHEWFANNITNKDVADMWIHEGFTAYSESLFVEYQFSPFAGAEYVVGTRQRIRNDKPIIGTYNMDKEGSSDMYYKGSNLLHTVRQLIDDDAVWRSILKGLNKDFKHQTVTSKQVEDYVSEKSGIDLTQVWDQYLRTTKIPTIEYHYTNFELSYRYTNIVEGFDMPVVAMINGKEKWLQPTATWQTFENIGDIKEFYVKYDFYVQTKKVEM